MAFRPVAAAVVVSVSLANAFLLHAHSPLTAAPTNVRLPDESGGIDAIARTLISVFDQADILALGESHAQQWESDLRIALVRHPDFGKKVRFIVVEFGSASRQATLDRYIRGEDVPTAELEQVWKTTQVGGEGSPIYPAFFAAVRAVNLKLPADARIRVFGAAGAPGMNSEATAVGFLKQEDPKPSQKRRLLEIGLCAYLLIRLFAYLLISLNTLND